MSQCYRAMTASEEGAAPSRRGILGAARWLLAPPRRTRHSFNRRAPDGSTQSANAARIRSTRPRRARCDTYGHRAMKMNFFNSLAPAEFEAFTAVAV
jgi:hypothetical protein